MRILTVNKASLIGILLFAVTSSLVMLLYSFKTQQQNQVQEISTIKTIKLI